MTAPHVEPRVPAIVVATFLVTAAALIAAPKTTQLDQAAAASTPGQDADAETAASAFDPATTAYVVTSGAGRGLPGCGAISAIETRSGEVLYRTAYLGSRAGLTAAGDFATFVAGAGQSPRLTFLDARDPRPAGWTAHEVWSPSGPYRIAGEAVLIQGDDLYLGMVRDAGRAWGIGRVALSRFLGTSGLQDINPIDGFYSTRREEVIQIIPDPFGRHLNVLSLASRLPEDPGEVIESYDMRVHTVDTDIMAARTAPLDLPPLVVNEPPGAGLREVGVHTWSQNGRLAWATMLYAGGKVYGREGRYLVVNRWLEPDLIIADLYRNSGPDSVKTVSLPSDFTIAGAVAANHGWMNPGLLAVHGGDKIAIFDVDPGTVRERARLAITPVVSPITDDRRMMTGPLAWSADGSQLIAAGNEGSAEVLIIDVDDCGDRMTLRHTVTACPYADYNGAAGFIAADGWLDPPASLPAVCPTPIWWPEEERVGSPRVVGLPWAGSGR